MLMLLALLLTRPVQEPTIKPSQHGTVTQTVAATTITVDYNRPVARGRELFGKLVPYDKVWCPGADDCTIAAKCSRAAAAVSWRSLRTYPRKSRYAAAETR